MLKIKDLHAQWRALTTGTLDEVAESWNMPRASHRTPMMRALAAVG